MKIAITGATGGLGRSLSEFLLIQGQEVVALGRNHIIGRELEKAGACFSLGDIGDPDYLVKSFQGCDVIVHCAGLASPWGSWDSFYQANVVGTQNVLRAAHKHGIDRLIHLSSPSVYFSGKTITQGAEDFLIPEPKTFYAKSKIMADRLVLEETASRKLSAVLFRPRSIFGKYDRTILPRILRVMQRGFFPLPGGGRATVDVTAVENCIHAIWLALNSKNFFRGEVFNITNGEPLTVRELMLRISEAFQFKVKFFSAPLGVLNRAAKLSELYAQWITHREPLISQYSLESLGTTQTFSIEKARFQLGYSPIVSLNDAIAELARSAQQAPKFKA